MSTNLIQRGGALDYVAPTGGVAIGALVLLTDLAGVARNAIAAGETGAIETEGVWQITKTAHAAGGFTQGDAVYSSATGLITNAATGNTFVGTAAAASATGATSVNVLLNRGHVVY